MAFLTFYIVIKRDLRYNNNFSSFSDDYDFFAFGLVYIKIIIISKNYLKYETERQKYHL